MRARSAGLLYFAWCRHCGRGVVRTKRGGERDQRSAGAGRAVNAGSLRRRRLTLAAVSFGATLLVARLYVVDVAPPDRAEAWVGFIGSLGLGVLASIAARWSDRRLRETHGDWAPFLQLVGPLFGIVLASLLLALLSPSALLAVIGFCGGAVTSMAAVNAFFASDSGSTDEPPRSKARPASGRHRRG